MAVGFEIASFPSSNCGLPLVYYDVICHCNFSAGWWACNRSVYLLL